MAEQDGATLMYIGSRDHPMFVDAEKRFFDEWIHPTYAKPTVINVFYVNHRGHQVWFDYDEYRKTVGNQHYMWHGTQRVCTIGDDNLQLRACRHPYCGVCNILRATLDPARANPITSMFGIGAYVAPNSSKSCKSTYLRNAPGSSSPNLVLLRVSVNLGKTYLAKKAMEGIIAPPPGFDSVTGVTKENGGALKFSESVVYRKEALLPIQAIVLRFSDNSVLPRQVNTHHQAFTKRLLNVGGGSECYLSSSHLEHIHVSNNNPLDWNAFPESIQDTFEGEILWTNGDDNHQFASRPLIWGYKVVRRSPADDPTGAVVQEGYASNNPFYFKLLD